MGPNFKVNPKLIVLSAFVALISTTQLVEAGLPAANKDVTKATFCMRKFFGETESMKNFLKNGHILTNGEYLGVICKEVMDAELYEMIRKNAAEDYDGKTIKECLAKSNGKNLFQKFVALGQKFLASKRKPMIETSESDESRQKPSSVPNSESLLDIPAMNFYRGVCDSPIKALDFSELKKENEKKEAVQCLTICAGNFINRVTAFLNRVRNEAIKSPSNKLSKSEINMLQNIADPSREFTSEKFITEVRNTNQPLSIDPITQIGTEYLISCNKIYYNLDMYMNDTVRSQIFQSFRLDSLLSAKRMIYEDCAELDCSISSESSPLYNLIKSGAEDSYWKILKTFENDEWVKQHPGEWQKFCRAFMEE